MLLNLGGFASKGPNFYKKDVFRFLRPIVKNLRILHQRTGIRQIMRNLRFVANSHKEFADLRQTDWHSKELGVFEVNHKEIADLQFPDWHT
jgi:hypothetical protein